MCRTARSPGRVAEPIALSLAGGTGVYSADAGTFSVGPGNVIDLAHSRSTGGGAR